MGGTGAGKTTFSKRLAQETSAIIFSIDNWIQDLYEADKPDSPNFDWYMERIERAEKKIWKLVSQLESQGVNSILDLGFTLQKHREKFLKLAQEENFQTKIYFLDISPNVRWKRVEQRNREQNDTFVMQVDLEIFEFMESRFEHPSATETKIVTTIKE